MAFSDTTDNLVKLAVDHLTALGFTDVRVDDSDEDFTDKHVTPQLTSSDRHWYLNIAGTDYEYVEEPGIDVVFVRPEGDDQITLDDFEQLDRLLATEGYLAPP